MNKHIILLLCSFILSVFADNQILANGLAQDCSRIEIIQSDSKTGKEIGTAIETFIKDKIDSGARVSKFRTIEALDSWVIAEVEFDLEEPGIFVLEKGKAKYRVAGVFGGAVLENPADTIKTFFKKELPKAPGCLFDCYKPHGAPFN